MFERRVVVGGADGALVELDSAAVRRLVEVILLGRRRVVRTLPTWRASLIRVGSLLPSRTGGAFRGFERVGRRVMRRA